MLNVLFNLLQVTQHTLSFFYTFTERQQNIVKKKKYSYLHTFTLGYLHTLVTLHSLMIYLFNYLLHPFYQHWWAFVSLFHHPFLQDPIDWLTLPAVCFSARLGPLRFKNDFRKLFRCLMSKSNEMCPLNHSRTGCGLSEAKV